MADSQKYKPLLHDNPLCGISTYKDTLNLATGACTRQIKKLVLTGNEEYSNDWRPATGTYAALIKISSTIPQSDNVIPICTHLQGKHYDYLFTGEVGVSRVPSSVYCIAIRVPDTIAANQSELVSWLATEYANGTPVTVWYVLATPTTETITVPTGLSGTEEGYLAQSETPTPTNPVYPTANEVLIWQHSLRKLTTATEAIENPLYSDGTAITSYTIKGNTVQNGTPTPSNPVEVNGVGVRTENSFNINGTYTTQGSNSVSNNQINAKCAGSNESYMWFDDTILSGTYKLSLQFNDGLRNVRILCSKAFSGGTYNSYYGGWYAALNNGEITITVSEDFKIGFNFIGDAGATGTVYNIMFSTDTNADYEPYGYKIPISSGGVTTNIYLGSTQTVRQIGCIDMSEYNFTYIPQFQIWECTTIPNVKYASSSTELGNALAEKYINHTASGLYAAVNNFAISTSSVSVNTGSDSISPSGKLYYALATPQTAAVNEPLMKIGDYADTLSNATAIPTTEGANSITVDTTVQPSEFTATWTGWHDASVKEKSRNLLNISAFTDGYNIGNDGLPYSFPSPPNQMRTCNLVPIDVTAMNSCTLSYTNSGVLFIFSTLNNGTLIERSAGNASDTVIDTSLATELYICFYTNGDISKTAITNAMLNTGSTSLPYEPYWK